VHRQAEHWAPSASLETLRARAGLVTRIRAFLAARGVLEVETPQLAPVTATDPLLDSVPAQPFRDGRDWFLQTSPEFAMKRLLAAGSGPIYQLGKCFRRGEEGPRHNPEFTMLEWYRPGFDLEALIAEVGELIAVAVPGLPLRRDSYRSLFAQHAGIDPFRDSDSRLRESAAGLAPDAADWDRDALLDLLFSARVEPHLGDGCLHVVTDFPASQAALARTRLDMQGDRVAARFEVFIRGLEIANGYDELCDPQELRRRFAADNAERLRRGLLPVPSDERLLAAMTQGLPDCAGVALGVDRLLMVALGKTRIDEVMAFTAERA
jgi:lysyl-tRNA synthetase class 2